MRNLVGAFFGRMDRYYLGENWLNLPVTDRTDGIGFIEHTDSNIHAHVLARFSNLEKRGNVWGRNLMAIHYWRNLCESGSVVIKPIYDLNGLAHYCSKELKYAFHNDVEQIIFLREFFPKG